MRYELPKSIKGFTLIELLVVIGILAILLSIVLIAINPARQFQQANDTQRRSDVNAILNAVHQYAADNRGSLPTGITTSPTAMGDGGLDICSDLVPVYIAEMPFDPTTGSYTDCSTYSTGYLISSGASNRVTVSATGEIESDISITR